MENVLPEYHGNQDQQAMMKRADDLWRLVRDDTRYCCHGRAVALAEFTLANADLQIALARLQGVGACNAVPSAAVSDRRGELENAGLIVDQYETWRGEGNVLEMAEAVLSRRDLSKDLEVCVAEPQTPTSDMAGLNALTQSCGVLLPIGSFMRGVTQPAVCVYAKDRNGAIVGTSAAVAQFHPDHQRGPEAWWGMLATAEERRGESIALIMGAKSIVEMHNLHGTEIFFTGIRKGNRPSENLCSKLGLLPTGNVDMIAIDPVSFSGGQLTK